jgi:hypothetical protein
MSKRAFQVLVLFSITLIAVFYVFSAVVEEFNDSMLVGAWLDSFLLQQIQAAIFSLRTIAIFIMIL